MVKVIAFDVFNTVFDLSSLDRSDMEYYINGIKSGRDGSIWQPLFMPANWYALKAHSDSKEGIDRLRKKYEVVTLSNGPVHLLSRISKRNDISWDNLIPIECIRKYKPNIETYMFCASLMNTAPSKCLMVTSNEKFGDLECSKIVGMQSYLVDRTKGETIIDLAEKLEC